MKFMLALILMAIPQQADAEKRIKDRQAALTTALKSAKTPSDTMVVADAIFELSEDAVKENLYDLSLKLLDQAQKIAVSAKDTAFVARASGRANEIKDIQKEFLKARAALKTVMDSPEDAEANLLVGKFLCFYKNEWELGIANLAKGSDKELKAVAEKDVTQPKEPTDQLVIGNAWWDLAKSKKQERTKLLQRALFWYEKAWDFLPRADRIPVRSKVEEVLRRSTKDAKMDFPTSWGGGDPKMLHLSDMYAHTGQRSIFMQRLPEAKNELVFSQLASVIPGETYSVSAWVLTDGDNNCVLRVLPDKFASFPKDKPFWTRISFDFVIPAATANVTLQFILYSSGKDNSGRVWIDDVSLVRKDTNRELLVNFSFEEK